MVGTCADVGWPGVATVGIGPADEGRTDEQLAMVPVAQRVRLSKGERHKPFVSHQAHDVAFSPAFSAWQEVQLLAVEQVGSKAQLLTVCEHVDVLAAQRKAVPATGSQ